MDGDRRWLGDIGGFLAVVGLLAGVSLLPPDTSLAQVRQAGILRVCVPTEYPPLVTADAAAPGIDVELVRALAKGLGIELLLAHVPAMGQDFNPRNWRVTRAQCQVLAGGVVGSQETRSFLETTAPHVQTGWASIARGSHEDLRGKRVGVHAGVSGLDRTALASELRAMGAQIAVVASAAELEAGLRGGRFDAAATELLQARRIAADLGWTATPFPGALGRQPVVLGLWKGDLTLKRAIARELGRLEREGAVARILARYLGPEAAAERRQGA